MEIPLKQKWDTQINAPYHNSLIVPDNSLFIGRAKEIDLLKNDILQKDQGSILVAGHRGVGKTSFVYKVLHLVKSETDKTNASKPLFIYINAGQLDNNGTGEAGQITTETILKTLIRRLYATSRDFFTSSEVFEQGLLKKLYKKAVAKEFKLEQQILNTNTDTESRQKNIEKKLSIDLKLSQVAPAILFVIGLGMFIFAPEQTTFVYKALSFVLSLPLIISYSVNSKMFRSNEIQKQVKAEELYQIDNNLGNLEYDLEEFHRHVQSRNTKIIYIIDELDKLSVEQEFKVLRYLKNLFTLSKAIFIFISNEDIYIKASAELIREEQKPDSVNEKINPERINEKFRSEYYTFFTSKFFISRPTMNELKEFFFSRIDESADKESLAIQRASHYLAYESKGDYFNLLNTIKDSIIRYENGQPIMDIAVNSPVVVKKSRLHKCVSVVFYQMYFSENFSRMRENELLYRELIDYIYKLKEGNILSKWDDPEDSTKQASAIRDINRLLSSLNFLEKVSDRKSNINDFNTVVSSYVCTGLFNGDPPNNVEIFSENEKRLLSLANEYIQALLPIVNIVNVADKEEKIDFKELCDNIGTLISRGIEGVELTSSQWCDIYFGLQLQLPVRDHSPEVVENSINELSDAISKIKISGISIFKAQILRFFAKNNFIIPEAAGLLDTLREIATLYEINWSDFSYARPEIATDQNPLFLFGPHSDFLPNALVNLEEKGKDFNNGIILSVLYTNPETFPFYAYDKKNVQIYLLDVSTPERVLESIEKTVIMISETTKNNEKTKLSEKNVFAAKIRDLKKSSTV